MTTSLSVVLSLLGLSLLALLVTGQEIYSQLSYLWVFFLLGNYLLSRISLSNLDIQRKPRRTRGQVGEIFEETFELHNRSRLMRAWVEIEDQTSLPGSTGSRVLTLVGGHRKRSYVSRIRLAKRGAFPLGPTILRSGDPFGMFPVSREFASEKVLTVYPRMLHVRSFPSPVGLLPGGEAIRRRTHQITPNASNVRDYENGDPINRIHWRSTARRDKLIVKEFELDPLAEVWLFLDAQAEVQAAKPFTFDADAGQVMLGRNMDARLAPSTEEYIASIAASLSQYFLDRGRTLALMMSGQFRQDLPPDRGPRQFGKIMEALALMQADGELPFSAFVLNHARRLPQGSTILLITPSAHQDVAFAVDSLQRLGLRPVLVLLDAASFGAEQSNRSLEQRIRALGVPVILIEEGEDVSAKLNAQSSLIRRYFPLSQSLI